MDRLNQWLTLLANIGVIVGIVFLAFEIQQNTEMMKAQTRDSMAAKQMQIAEWVLTSEFEAGLYDEEEFEARHNTWETVMGNQRARNLWPLIRESFSPRFRDHIDDMVSEASSADRES